MRVIAGLGLPSTVPIKKKMGISVTEVKNTHIQNNTKFCKDTDTHWADEDDCLLWGLGWM